MPAITAKQKNSKQLPNLFEPKISLLLLLCGAVLGLSAPGINLWFIAWFGLVPLLLASSSSTGIWQAFWRGTVFGIGYNLVYLNWYLGLQPLDWLLFNWWQGALIATAAWTIVSTHQALIVGIFSAIAYKIPMQGSFLFRKTKGQWKAPALLVIPILWTIVVNLLCNARGATGAPWTMLEYSQYKQISLIQIASIIGGIGLGLIIVMTNTALAVMLASMREKSTFKSLVGESKSIAFYQVIAIVILLVGIIAFGFNRASTAANRPDLDVTVLQGNINIEMQKTTHKYTLLELLAHYTTLVRDCPSGLLVWTENALPTYLKDDPSTLAKLAEMARMKKLDMVVGSMDHNLESKPFNSAYGITASGHVIPETYHKRYLVPFGEYTPELVRYMPEWMRRLTNTPAGGGFASGTDPVALPLACGSVAPLICFETLSPGLVASSVRKGGCLLVNVSDLAWFHSSMVGEQMIAFSVLRAVENERYFVFGANTGPSAIIDAEGRVVLLSEQNKERLLTGKVMLSSEITPFTRWFMF